MKKQITTIALTIFMLSLTAAMYAGESTTFETNLTNPVFTVIGNSSSLEGLTVEFENGNITVSTVLNFKPDNFTIVFFDEVTREVVKRVGGSHTEYEYIDKNVTVYIPKYIKEIVNECNEPTDTCDYSSLSNVTNDELLLEQEKPNYKTLITVLVSIFILFIVAAPLIAIKLRKKKLE